MTGNVIYTMKHTNMLYCLQYNNYRKIQQYDGAQTRINCDSRQPPGIYQPIAFVTHFTTKNYANDTEITKTGYRHENLHQLLHETDTLKLNMPGRLYIHFILEMR